MLMFNIDKMEVRNLLSKFCKLYSLTETQIRDIMNSIESFFEKVKRDLQDQQKSTKPFEEEKTAFIINRTRNVKPATQKPGHSAEEEQPTMKDSSTTKGNKEMSSSKIEFDPLGADPLGANMINQSVKKEKFLQNNLVDSRKGPNLKAFGELCPNLKASGELLPESTDRMSITRPENEGPSEHDLERNKEQSVIHDPILTEESKLDNENEGKDIKE
eukprot:CAMPEP_0176467558 /NCGR_PEP_ID=MMETSP0127-20121128/38528_1 /TAXON_ID=938130 /ORGANISM="Platyophrya macrostoma, Strain WH" /LENGTH=215 /DNA_ID=CAMNT_0017860877 /DNA_START=342 /DNA_END=989 /DNA_ORIENTATION=-